MAPRDQDHRHVAKFLSRLGGALFILGFLYLVYLAVSFIAAPTMPIAASGQVVAWSDHGTNHYITVQEHSRLIWTMLFCGGMFFCAALGIYLERLNNKQ